MRKCPRVKGCDECTNPFGRWDQELSETSEWDSSIGASKKIASGTGVCVCAVIMYDQMIACSDKNKYAQNKQRGIKGNRARQRQSKKTANNW